MNPFVNQAPHFISNEFTAGHGSHFQSLNPSTNEPLWEGSGAEVADIETAVQAARRAFADLSHTSLEIRISSLRGYAQILQERKEELIAAICAEVGKPPWEAATEVNAMIGKIDLSIKAYLEKCSECKGGPAVTRFKPHGVVAVFGAYNFPGHIPNGHIVPALLAGNAVVFKPSEQAPLVAQRMAECFLEAGFPPGVFNMVQGAAKTGALLAANSEIDALFFTGSSKTGLVLRNALASSPEKILALEMGGNNPLIAHKISDKDTAALLIIQSAYLTAGQRCTCARRLIVPVGQSGDELIEILVAKMHKIRVGTPESRPEPFMGPVISAAAAENLLQTQKNWLSNGGRALVPMKSLSPGTGLVSPGLVNVTAIKNRSDTECFGPLLQLIRVKDFEEAVVEANRTKYGLSAGLLSDDARLYEYFFQNVKAGIINWNQQLTGASGAAPFGGVGHSGNHRPGGYFTADFCSYPVASIEKPKLEPAKSLPPGLS